MKKTQQETFTRIAVAHPISRRRHLNPLRLLQNCTVATPESVGPST